MGRALQSFGRHLRPGCGPGGTRYAGQAYNPRTGGYAQTRGGSNVYGSWNQTAVQRGDSWAQSARYTNRTTGSTTRVATGSGGDVYAGHDGNVYRKQGDYWQKYDSGGWNSVQKPSQSQIDQGRGQAQQRASQVDRSTYEGLNRDSAARADGAQRTRDFSSYQRSGGSTAGSYRSTGASRPSGGYRGGGGMRGGGGGRRR
jgi:hypothetical protein